MLSIRNPGVPGDRVVAQNAVPPLGYVPQPEQSKRQAKISSSRQTQEWYEGRRDQHHRHGDRQPPDCVTDLLHSFAFLFGAARPASVEDDLAPLRLPLRRSRWSDIWSMQTAAAITRADVSPAVTSMP